MKKNKIKKLAPPPTPERQDIYKSPLDYAKELYNQMKKDSHA